MAIKATVSRIPDGPDQFMVTITTYSGSHSRVLRTDYEGLHSRLREWKLGERTIHTILHIPLGSAVTFKLDANEARREERPRAPLVA